MADADTNACKDTADLSGARKLRVGLLPVTDASPQTETISSIYQDGFVVQFARIGYEYILYGGVDTPGGPDWQREYTRPLSTADTARWADMMQHLLQEMRQKAAR